MRKAVVKICSVISVVAFILLVWFFIRWDLYHVFFAALVSALSGGIAAALSDFFDGPSGGGFVGMPPGFFQS